MAFYLSRIITDESDVNTKKIINNPYFIKEINDIQYKFNLYSITTSNRTHNIVYYCKNDNWYRHDDMSNTNILIGTIDDLNSDNTNTDELKYSQLYIYKIEEFKAVEALVEAEEVEADELAGSLEKDIDHLKALKIAEAKLRRIAKQVSQKKKLVSERIIKNL